MTATEDDLRSALRLLEQRAPADRPDVRAVAPRSWWAPALRLGSVAALVLVVVGGAALLGRHHDGAQPTQSGPTAPTETQVMPPAAGRATLYVRVALFGGPVKPNGRMADDDRPQPGATVTVTSVAKQGGAYSSQLRVSSITNRHGVATFTVPPGRYRFRWDVFRGERPVRLTAGEVTHVQIDCAVP